MGAGKQTKQHRTSVIADKKWVKDFTKQLDAKYILVERKKLAVEKAKAASAELAEIENQINALSGHSNGASNNAQRGGSVVIKTIVDADGESTTKF